jgi:pSer/pThr/pTyr-binding forkhead associated (FHA) protein
MSENPLLNPNDEIAELLVSAAATVIIDQAAKAELLPRLEFVAQLLARTPIPVNSAALLYETANAVRVMPIGEQLCFGRAAECEISVPGYREVSRLHFTIMREDEHYILADADSANGTFVRGLPDRIARRELVDGDIIDAGGFSFVFVRE